MTRTAKHRATTVSRRPALLAAVIAAFAVTVVGSLMPTAASSGPLDDPAAIRQACIDQLAARSTTLTPAQRTWLRNCRDAMAPPSATPTPSASGTPSPTPTASPTGSPTPSQTPTASPTATPSPSQSPTASPTPTVSPTGSPSPTPTVPAGGCMPQPSACGYPDTTNTGVPRMIVLTPFAGDYHANTAGQTVDSLDISGCVYIEASNVTIRNSRIRGDCYFSIRTTIDPRGVTGLTVEDTEIVLSATKEGSYGICCSNYTMSRTWIHGSPNGNAGADCVYLNSNVIVQDTFCEVGPAGPGNCYGNPNCTSAHSDGMSSDGGNNVALIHNTIRNPNQQTSAILLSTNSGSVTNSTIRDGLYAGGGITVYCGTDSGRPQVGAGTVFVGNRIARDWNGSSPGYYASGGFFGPVTHCADAGVVRGGNVWDQDGALIAGAN